jgi:pimeloyl-ACP methyl ester carboxylesterase
MRKLLLLMVGLVLAHADQAQETVSIPTSDGGVIFADLYGQGARGLVLAHGGQFNKESWRPQAEQFAVAGFHVLAFDFRGYGKSHGPGQADIFTAPLELDVLAAVRYLHSVGAKTVSIVGGSLGGGAAGDASIRSVPGEIDRIVFLGSSPNGPADKLKSASLFLVARDDTSGDGPRLPGIRAQFERAPQPKRLVILDGSAHAQFLFQTPHAKRVMEEILLFLSPEAP